MNGPDDEHGRGGSSSSGLLARVRQRLRSDDETDDGGVPAVAGLDDRFTAGVATAWRPDSVPGAGANDRTVGDD